MRIVKLFFDQGTPVEALLQTLEQLYSVATMRAGTMITLDVHNHITNFLESFRRPDQEFPAGGLDKAENLLEALFGSNFRSAYVNKLLAEYKEDNIPDANLLVLMLNPYLEEDTKREGEVLCAYLETPAELKTASADVNPSTKIASITAEIIRLEGLDPPQLYMAANQIITRVFKA